MSEKAIYQVIADELKTNNVEPALWTQAIAEAAGEPDKIQATYIRLRFADLKKAASPQTAPVPSLNNAEIDLTVQDSRLIPLRAELKKKLMTQAKTSLYAALGLQPDASSSLVAAAIADFESSGQVGTTISEAEFRYAKETLGDPAAREQYDRKLLNSLAYGGGGKFYPMPMSLPATIPGGLRARLHSLFLFWRLRWSATWRSVSSGKKAIMRYRRPRLRCRRMRSACSAMRFNRQRI